MRDVGGEPVVGGGLVKAASFKGGGAGFRANTTVPELGKLLSLPPNA